MPSKSWVMRKLLLQCELIDVDIACAEQVRAAGQVFHVSVVGLFGLNRDRLVCVSFQRGRPQVERLRVVRLQRLRLRRVAPTTDGVLTHHRYRRQPSAGKNFGQDELEESSEPE